MPATPLVDWRPFRSPRRPTVVRCSKCGRVVPNEHNATRGWQETGSGWAVAYRCPDCSAIADGRVLDDVPESAP